MNPTRITEILDELGIVYRVLPHDEPVYTIAVAARQRHVTPGEMVKAILLVDVAGRYVMACTRGDDRVDPRAVRAYLGEGWRRLRFATADEIAAVTGCIKGAVAPVGLPPEVPVLFDVAIERLPKVSISSGDLMAGLELATPDLIRVASARLAPIAARLEEGGIA